MKKIRIWYTDFWSDLKLMSKDNFFTKLLSERYVVELDPDKPDLLFYSVFGKDNERWSGIKKVFYTGENRKSNNNYDLSFSFDYQEDTRHIRLPLYSYFCYEENSFEKLFFKRKTKGLNFCSFMVGNLNHGNG